MPASRVRVRSSETIFVSALSIPDVEAAKISNDKEDKSTKNGGPLIEAETILEAENMACVLSPKGCGMLFASKLPDSQSE